MATKRPSREWPRILRVGSVVVRVYQVNHATAKTGKAYVLSWSTPRGRRTQKFADPSAAIQEARLRAAQLAAGRIEAADISRSDLDELEAARDLAGDVPLVAAIEEWRKAKDLVKGPLLPVAEAWAARNRGGVEPIQISELSRRFLAAKTAAGIRTATNHGGVFVDLKKDFGDRDLDSIGAGELNTWLARREHPSTRNTYRKQLVVLWRWAQKQGFLPREIRTEAELTDRALESPLEIGIISAGTFREVLEHFRAKHVEYLGALVLAGFCGLRRAEIHAQRWADVDLARRYVRVTKAKRGTPSRRLVPLCEAAVAWLMLCEERKDDLCSNLAMDRIRNIGKDAKFDLPENCFRHGFVSHRVAAAGNVAETALEAGNSPAIIFKHYRELVSKDEGAEWFEIRPKAAGEVIALQAAK